MYKRPSYDIKTTGIFTFKTKDKEYLLKSYSFERENDTEDSLEIQDELRGEIGSIRIKNSAWNKLAKGQTILAKTSKSKGDIVGKLTRIDDINNSLKYAKGGISGDIFSVKDPKMFKQILTIYNEFSEKFGVDNYFLDHNDNSVIFLRKKPFTPTEIDNMSKRIFSLKEKQDFDVLNKNKNTESSRGTFKFFLKNSIKYADGGMSIANANPYIAGAKAVQGIAPESVSALDKRISSRINPDPNRPVFFNLGGRLDLFEDYENIPANVQAVLDKYAENFGDDFSEMDYSDTAKMQKDIEKLGYTFDSGLDNQPYGLRPIGVKLSELQGFEDDEEYAKGGWILYDADTDSKIGEFETETKARKMMYEYEGNSNIVPSSVWGKSSEKDKIYKNNTMEKKTSRFAKGGATYIPNRDIESIKLRYGKTIKGSKLLDGAYAKGNLKLPTMSRTQFEDESFEYAKGGGVGNFKVVTWSGDYGGEDNNYYVVDETENEYLTVQEDMFNKWKNADKFDRAEYYSEWIPKSEMVETKKMAKGGGVNSKRHTPRIYVADLEAYNNGRLKGEWIDLSDFDSGAEVLEEISKMLKKTGGEEYAIHDYEYFPSIMYSEYMGEKQFDNVIEAYKIAEDKDLDIDVVGEIIEQYSPDNVEEFIDDNYEGQFDNDTDFAYQYVENLGGFENINESEKEMYFDYEAFGRDLVINDFFTINDHYFVNPRYARGGTTYIPNRDIESIKLRYGKTIKGSKLLDGAYAKGNLKTPTMSRTQFEDESFEYAKGGGIKSEYHIFEGMNHRNGNPIYRVESNFDSENEYVGEWHTSKSEAEEELADCSSKYAKGGGVSYHNGREYATGRNWTNDHKHENRSEDWEVAQADRKRYAKGGGLSYHNGREYATGRNWTNDHQHENRNEDWEVAQADRKRFANGSGIDDINLIAKAIEYIKGKEIDSDTIHYEANRIAFKFQGKSNWSTIDSKIVQDTINMHRKSLEIRGKYAMGGGVGKHIYNVAFSTKNGSSYVANNIEASSEAEAISKLEKQMRASKTYDKVISVSKKYSLGGEIETKIAKLQVVIDSKLLPDSVKASAKTKQDALRKELHESKETKAEEKAEHKVGGEEARKTVPTQKAKPTEKPKAVVEPKIQIKAIKLQPKATAQEKPKVVVAEKPKVVVSEKPKATVITKTTAKTTSTKKYDNRGSKKPDSEGRFKRSITSDKKRTALPLGKRTSADGNVYYENRLNRADRNPSKKYETGGGVDKSKKEDDMSNEMLFKKTGSLPKGRFTKK